MSPPTKKARKPQKKPPPSPTSDRARRSRAVTRKDAATIAGSGSSGPSSPERPSRARKEAGRTRGPTGQPGPLRQAETSAPTAGSTVPVRSSSSAATSSAVGPTPSSSTSSKKSRMEAVEASFAGLLAGITDRDRPSPPSPRKTPIRRPATRPTPKPQPKPKGKSKKEIRAELADQIRENVRTMLDGPTSSAGDEVIQNRAALTSTPVRNTSRRRLASPNLSPVRQDASDELLPDTSGSALRLPYKPSSPAPLLVTPRMLPESEKEVQGHNMKKNPLTALFDSDEETCERKRVAAFNGRNDRDEESVGNLVAFYDKYKDVYSDEDDDEDDDEPVVRRPQQTRVSRPDSDQPGTSGEPISETNRLAVIQALGGNRAAGRSTGPPNATSRQSSGAGPLENSTPKRRVVPKAGRQRAEEPQASSSSSSSESSGDEDTNDQVAVVKTGKTKKTGEAAKAAAKPSTARKPARSPSPTPPHNTGRRARGSRQPTSYAGLDVSAEEDPEDEVSLEGLGRARKSPSEVARIKKEKEEKAKEKAAKKAERERVKDEKRKKKEDKEAEKARLKRVEAKKKLADDADKATKRDQKKLQKKNDKKKKEEDRAARQLLRDTEKDKDLAILRKKRRKTMLNRSAKKRHSASFHRLEALKLQGDKQRIARASALARSCLCRRSTRLQNHQQNQTPPEKLQRPSGRSKSEPPSSRGRFLNAKREFLRPRRSRYLENLDLALQRMQTNLTEVAMFEQRASKAIEETISRDWSKFADPFAAIRQERLRKVRSSLFLQTDKPDFDLDISDTDRIDPVEERWAPAHQRNLFRWSDPEAREDQQFREIIPLVQQFGFVSLRELKIATCDHHFDLDKKKRLEGVQAIVQKFQLLIDKWSKDTGRKFPRVIHYWKFVLTRLKPATMREWSNQGDGRKTNYENFRDMLFFLPLHLGDVVDKEHLPRTHLIDLARQMLRVLLNEWPLRFQPCPEDELHALYRLELAALRLEASLGPTTEWLVHMKPNDQVEFWAEIDEERHIQNSLPRTETKAFRVVHHGTMDC